MNPKYANEQIEIIKALHINKHFNAEDETQKRINFIKNQLLSSHLKTLVLGISGGIDSTVTGRMAQIAVEELRKEHYPAHFIAIRLPYGTQADEKDAQAALQFINPDKTLTINIKNACDELLDSVIKSSFHFENDKQKDLVLANIKARQRMIAQYAIANAQQGLVIGTDHAAEALMGFFTKYGDGACDLTPLQGLNKRRIRSIAKYLNTPDLLTNKVPTADLENLQPQKSDEEAYGITYNEIDDFLEGKEVSENTYHIIMNAYTNSIHKRALPVMP